MIKGVAGSSKGESFSIINAQITMNAYLHFVTFRVYKEIVIVGTEEWLRIFNPSSTKIYGSFWLKHFSFFISAGVEAHYEWCLLGNTQLQWSILKDKVCRGQEQGINFFVWRKGIISVDPKEEPFKQNSKQAGLRYRAKSKIQRS